jgi:hypothetical protein
MVSSDVIVPFFERNFPLECGIGIISTSLLSILILLLK